MKLELTRVDGKLSGYKLIAENEEDMHNMGAARDLIFFGFDGNALSYAGKTTIGEGDEECVNSLAWVKRKYNEEYKDKWLEYQREDARFEEYMAEQKKNL